MFKMAKSFFIIVQTPLHAGSGSSLGIVDQPIQRERHTDFPKIEGSSLKGAIREVFEEYNISQPAVKNNGKEEIRFELSPIIEEKLGQDKFNELKKDWKQEEKAKKILFLIRFHEAISLAFGPDGGGDDTHAGALGFTDARLLLFPVKSMKGVFAWITCPDVLKRFSDDLKLCNGINDIFFNSNSMPAKWTVADTGSILTGGRVILEEYSFDVKCEDTTSNFARWLSEKTGISDIQKRLVILDNDEFRDFVNLSTEVITRTKIDATTGTVQTGALFTEEYLPSESIMYSLALTTPIFKDKDSDKGIFGLTAEEKKEKDPQKKTSEEKKVMEFFTKCLPAVMQIGGNATIGKGIVKTITWGTDNG